MLVRLDRSDRLRAQRPGNGQSARHREEQRRQDVERDLRVPKIVAAVECHREAHGCHAAAEEPDSHHEEEKPSSSATWVEGVRHSSRHGKTDDANDQAEDVTG